VQVISLFFSYWDKAVLAMAGIRVISSIIEMTGAILMLKFGTVDKAFKINALIACLAPFILLSVTGIGMIKLAETISFSRLLIISAGVVLIFLGMWKM
jgi:hypothetical protein